MSRPCRYYQANKCWVAELNYAGSKIRISWYCRVMALRNGDPICIRSAVNEIHLVIETEYHCIVHLAITVARDDRHLKVKVHNCRNRLVTALVLNL